MTEQRVLFLYVHIHILDTLQSEMKWNGSERSWKIKLESVIIGRFHITKRKV